MELNKDQKLKIIAKLPQEKQERILNRYGGDHEKATSAIENMQTSELAQLLRDAEIMEEAQALEDQLAQEVVLEGQASEPGSGGPDLSLEKAQKAVGEAEAKVRRSKEDSPAKNQAKNLVQRAKDNLNRANIALKNKNTEEAEQYAQKAISEANQAKKLVSQKEGKDKKADSKDGKKDEKSDAAETSAPKSGSGAVSKAQVAKKVASAEGSAADKAKTAGKEVAAEAAGEAAGDLAGAAAAETGPLALVIRKAVKWLVENVVRKVLSRPLWKNLLAAFGPQILTIILIVIGLSITSKAFAGNWGIGRGNSHLSGSTYGTSFQVDNIILGDVPFRDWYLHQCDKEWGKNLYTITGNNKQTMCYSGCGPTSMAMVLKRYGVTGYDNPYEVAKYCKKHNFRTANDGTDAGCFKKLAEEIGFNYKVVSDDKTALKLLANGMPLMLSVRGSYKMVGGKRVRTAPFTSGSGHFIVLAGRQGDTIFVNNSIIRNNTTTNIAEVRHWFKHGYYLIYPNDLSQFVNE